MEIEGKEVEIKAARKIRGPNRRIYIYRTENEDGISWALYFRRYMPKAKGLRMRDRVLVTKLALTNEVMEIVMRAFLEMSPVSLTASGWSVSWNPTLATEAKG